MGKGGGDPNTSDLAPPATIYGWQWPPSDRRSHPKTWPRLTLLQPKERPNTFFFTEIRAGMATFFAMAYIISVNSSIVAESGGTCVCPADSMADLCATNEEYLLCLQEIKRDAVTATAAISALASFCMGLFANMPIGLAPGMGLNAYFAYTVVGYHGSGLVPYEVALTAVFVEGWVFVGLTLLGIRQWLARIIPASLKLATAVGIGLYLTLIGLGYSAGIGVITGATDTPMELSGCLTALRDPDTGLCASADKMRSPTMVSPPRPSRLLTLSSGSASSAAVSSLSCS